MKNKKIVISAIAVCLVLALAAGGSFAYYKKEIASVTNTFTFVGPTGLDATLTEPSWDPDKALNLTPGASIPKDPTITNTGDIDAWMGIEVTFTKNDDSSFNDAETALLMGAVSLDWNTTDWTRYEGDADTLVQKFYYNTVLASANPYEETSPLFEHVTIASDISDASDAAMTLLEASGLKIVVKGCAVQSDAFTTISVAKATAYFTYA